jgi:flagellar motor switch protein FliM
MSVPLSPSELHSLFADLDLTPPTGSTPARPAAEVNRQWTGSDFGQDASHPLWMIEGMEAWQAEFRGRLREAFSQTHQANWDAQTQAATAIRLHHFVEANRVRQGFRCDSVVPGTPVWLVFDPHIVAVHLDLSLGATESPSTIGARVRHALAMGPLESRIMCRCVSTICNAMAPVTTLLNLREQDIESLSTNESWIAGIPFNLVTMLAVLEFRLSIGEHSGSLAIALTREGLQSLIPQWGFSSDSLSERPAEPGESESRKANSTLRVVLARATLSPDELAGLQVGDVVLTCQEADSPCEVWVDGVPRFEAAAVTFQDHKAVRLTRKNGEA